MKKGNISSFEGLLKTDKSFCIHQKDIQSMAIEHFKIKTTSLLELMFDISDTRNLYFNPRFQTNFIRARANTTSFRLNSFKMLNYEKMDIVPYDRD